MQRAESREQRAECAGRGQRQRQRQRQAAGTYGCSTRYAGDPCGPQREQDPGFLSNGMGNLVGLRVRDGVGVCDENAAWRRCRATAVGRHTTTTHTLAHTRYRHHKQALGGEGEGEGEKNKKDSRRLAVAKGRGRGYNQPHASTLLFHHPTPTRTIHGHAHTHARPLTASACTHMYSRARHGHSASRSQWQQGPDPEAASDTTPAISSFLFLAPPLAHPSPPPTRLARPTNHLIGPPQPVTQPCACTNQGSPREKAAGLSSCAVQGREREGERG